MIRAALVSIVFLGITLVLILMQPGAGTATFVPASPDENSVSRAETELDALSALSDSLSLITEEVEAVSASVSEPVDLTTPAVTPVPEIIAVETEPAPQPILSTSTDENGLERLIVNALSQGQSEAYIEALVNDAAQKGSVEIPDSLVTADGRVDTASLLSALNRTGLDAGVNETYMVQPGDSLASISYRFYGSTNQAADIFEANRNTLSSPTLLKAGQELVIPAL